MENQHKANNPEESCSAEEDMRLRSNHEGVSVLPPFHVSFGMKHGKRAGNFWRGRLKSRAFHCGPSLFSALSLCDKYRFPSQQNARKGLQNRVAWVDLDGCLVNADTATALTEVGSKLGEPESLVWEGLRPLQRVLIVAVAASAATTGTAKEVLRLRQIIAEQEEALVLMREELSSLFRQSQDGRDQPKTKAGEHLSVDSVDDLEYFLSQIDVEKHCRLDSEESNAHCANVVNIGADSFDSFDSGAKNLASNTLISSAATTQLCFSNFTRSSPIKEESSTHSGDAEQELIEKMVMSNNWVEALDIDWLLGEQPSEMPECPAAAAVNKDVVFEQNIREHEPEKENAPKDLVSNEEICVRENGERGNIPENASSFEWLSESSSVLMEPFSPAPSEKKVGRALKESEECSKDWLQRTMAEEKSVASRARCGNMVLDVKKQVIVMLDQTASDVLQALASISDKIKLLEVPETNALTPSKPEDAWNKKFRAYVIDKAAVSAFAAIQDKISMASRKVSSLQNAMTRLLDTRVPEVMASLDISPSEFDNYLANLQIAKILNDDACEPSSTESSSVETWQHWFRQGFGNTDSSFLKRLEASDVAEADTHVELKGLENSTPLSEWPPSGSGSSFRRLRPHQLSPGVAAFREKVEQMMNPLHEMSELDSVERSAQVVAISDDLVAEFEKCGAKVASLKTYVRGCDKKRKQVERKLLEAWEQDSKNQAKLGNEISELKRQVRLKDAAYQQLITSRKALVSSKAKEVAELREDCKRHNLTLQDMMSAAKATQETSEKRLAMLEEICKKKDSSIVSLKQEIFELEGKILELQACQTPAQLRPMDLPPSEREEDTDSTDDRYDNEAYRMVGDDCQLRSSYQSYGSETRRTSWGSDLSTQEFHIIDTPWSSELTAGQDFNIIEEAAFQGQTLNIFQNVATPSPEFFRGSVRKVEGATGGEVDANDDISSSSTKDTDARPTVYFHQEAKKDNVNSIPNCRKELSKSVTNLGLITGRSKDRDDRLRASTGVLAAVGPNTLFKPRRSTSFNKERSQSSLSGSKVQKPKENANINANRSKQKWV